MKDIDDFDLDEEYQEQIEQMIAQNGMLLHALVDLLIQKGIIQREELESQIDRLTAQLEGNGDA
jgi:transketolase N-terminal domain/subunit